MKYFLLTYDHQRSKLVKVQEFTDQRRASLAYARAERESGGDKDIEVVLTGAESIDVLRQTHGQYFDRAKPGKYLAIA